MTDTNADPLMLEAAAVRSWLKALGREILFSAGYIASTNMQISNDLMQALEEFESRLAGNPYVADKDDCND